jgi:hypothetical protein
LSHSSQIAKAVSAAIDAREVELQLARGLSLFTAEGQPR